MTKVSIIIPVYNREKLIKETLESIIYQTFSDWECILIDDGSSDKSIQVIKSIAISDPRIKVYCRPLSLNKGAPSCRNYGIDLSIGEYIQFFDSDDLMLRDMLQRKVSFLEENHTASFVVAKMGEFNSKGNLPTPEYKLKLPKDNLWNFMRYRVYFLTPGPLFRREFLDGFELKFDTSLDRRQEREFYTRIMLTGPEYLVINEVLSRRRIHDSSIKKQHEELSDLDQSKSSYFFYSKLSQNAGRQYAGLIFKAYRGLISHLIVSFFRKRSVKFVFKSSMLLSSLFLNKMFFKQRSVEK
ncbi:glycosyltransferase family 2 protein [uncultured Cyclobacterium sp.]|uniref:glycosyltransferase family 2 protein n=1 Tax=uncultured Cyclobacterium sp. TaxID=453820 RepID=UPI0030EC1949|tara:strand:- start:90423 stop:91316 length:894 start_codon:yes stop_codon:yes gene_type:complete